MRALPFRVLLITDRAVCAARGRGVIETVAQAFDGVDGRAVALLFRDKSSSAQESLATLTALHPLCRRAGARLLVHTHVELAARLGLLGAHLSSAALKDEGELPRARALLPPGALLGASAHEGDLIARELDYAFMSPVFAPTSKPNDQRAPLGLEGLRAACANSAAPLIALGGVEEHNARACLAAGAQAIAVLGGVMGALDANAALRGLLDAIA